MELMRHAKGSFGLVISHSLDATSGLVVAARGQTMSIAVYPQLGMVLFGSEAAATKAAMGMSAEARRADAAELDSPVATPRRRQRLPRSQRGRARPTRAGRARRRSRRRRPTAAELLSPRPHNDGPERARRPAQLESYRIDLDEVRGEVGLRWDHHPTRSSAADRGRWRLRARRSTMTTRRQRPPPRPSAVVFAAYVLVGAGGGGGGWGSWWRCLTSTARRHAGRRLRAAGSPRRQSVGRPASSSREGRPRRSRLADLPSVLKRTPTTTTRRARAQPDYGVASRTS